MQAINAPDSRKIETRPAQRASATLRDGSTAALGAESRIKVPFSFPRDIRAVGLEGTATFTVVPAASHVFDVRAKNVSVTAHTGVFTVRSYADDSSVFVRAKEGEIIVATAKESRPLAAGTAVAVGSDGTISALAGPAAEEALGWADGRLVVANRPLRGVIPEFKRWYSLDLYTKEPALQDRVVDSLNADLESSRTAVAALEKAAGVKLTFEGKTMVLQDARSGRGARR
jgi:transmembrane sensor